MEGLSNTVKVLEQCGVGPPPDPVPVTSLPLSFFDLIWLTFHPLGRVIFYDFPYSTDHFIKNTVPNLKTSLSLALKHFTPLAGNLLTPSDTKSNADYQIRYLDGDSVSVTFAECTADLNQLLGNHVRDANILEPLVPQLPSTTCIDSSGDNYSASPVFAIQVTVFSNRAICIGITNSHVVADGSTVFNFVRAWASIAKKVNSKLDADDVVVSSGELQIPDYDRSSIKDPHGLATMILEKLGPIVKVMLQQGQTMLDSSNIKVRATFGLTEANIRALKNMVLTKRPNLTYVSSFTVMCAYLWTCFAKSRATVYKEAHNLDEPQNFGFTMDCRARLDPPLPASYFGNCLVPCLGLQTGRVMIGDEGLAAAAEVLGNAIAVKLKEGPLHGSDKWMEDFAGVMRGEWMMGIAGSPKLDYYNNIDFGWGKPLKFEFVDEPLSLSRCKDSKMDERVELMDIAASRKGLPSILSLDSDTLQNLELFRDLLTEFPPKSVCLKKPFAVQPWTDSDKNVGSLFMVWRFLVTFADVLGIWPFTIDEFVQAFHDYDSRLLGEIHVALLKCIIKDIEDVARIPSFGLGTNQNSAANPGGGHPQIVEGAYAWGFDIRSWKQHLNPLTWPEILRQFALAAGFGPKLKKRSAEQTYSGDEIEGNDSEDVILKLRNGSAAKKALAIMHERGFSNPRRSRHRLTPGTVKYAAFHVLSLEGGRGLTILEVADKIQTSGLRDLTTSKTPEASIAAALSRDSKLFERTAPSTYCVRAPYRKDPADGESLLTAAREKIQIYKNGILNGEEVEDVDKDEADRDDDSESDAAEELEVEDISIKLKSNEDIYSCKPTDLLSEIKSANEKEISQEASEPSQHHVENVGMTSLQSSDLNDAKCIASSLDRSVDTAVIHNTGIVPYQEDTVIDESQSGEPWVQGLVEGEYSDLSVEERLNALVALIGVANEGNSIRFVLEDRMEAANALKKQMWADSQIDKRRMKEDYVMKIPFSSIICSKGEQNISTSFGVGRQSSCVVDGKSDFSSIHSEVKHEHSGDLYINSNSVPAERCLSVQELPAGTDNSPLQQAVYAAEKSRSHLKAVILHKAEEMYVYRSLPLGQDRRRNRYWQFITSASPNDLGTGRIFVQLCDDRWRIIDSEKDFDALLASLDVRGVRESHLFSMLQMIQMSFKKTVRKNSLRVTWKKVEEYVETKVPEMASDYNSCAAESPSSGICVSNPDMPESSSSFKIELGSNETERTDALKRYQEFEKWMWKECYNPSILRAIKHGKRRGKPVFSVCDFCQSLYTVEECCPCQYTSNICTGDSKFSEYVDCKEKLSGEARITDSSPVVRLRLLIAQLSSIEVSIPNEALQSVWSDDSRKSWGMKLQSATSAEELLQILTLLEGGIKRDFMLSDYETTSELLVSIDSTGSKTHGTVTPEAVPVLPWLPQTTSSVALRLMELDSSICYLLSQKEDSQKEKGYSDLVTVPSSFAAEKKYISEGLVAEASHDAGSLHQEACTSGLRSSGQGRGRVRGHGHSYGSRSQNRARQEAGPRNTAKADGFKQLKGWKSGKTRGRGGRKRGQWSVGSRSAKNKQKAIKKSTGVSGERGKTRDTSFDRTPTSSVLKWNPEPPLAAYSPGRSSNSDFRSEDNDEHGLASGEYDNIMVDNYPSMYNSRELEYEANGDEDYDDRAEEEEDDNDDDMDDLVEDEQEDVQRYFNSYSDEDENMEDINRKQTGNTDDITESTSEYSD